MENWIQAGEVGHLQKIYRKKKMEYIMQMQKCSFLYFSICMERKICSKFINSKLMFP